MAAARSDFTALKLPPLNALRAFEAIARLGSVRLAAVELSVTPAAVSQQLRGLEDYLGQPLFSRLPRALQLTSAGREYQRVVTRSLRAIADATAQMRPQARSVAISCVPSFATLWLAPRMAQFFRVHPNIDIHIEAEPTLTDFRTSPYDLGIREGAGRYRDTEVSPLFAVELVPVAAPGYCEALRHNGRFDWSKARLLFEESTDNWARWFDQRGVRLRLERGVYFSLGAMALAAATEGEGVALASFCLVEQAVRAGRLEIVEPVGLTLGSHYWLAWPHAGVRALSESAVLFRDWIIEQARQTQLAAPQLS